jgi:adenylate cyclase
MERPLAILFVDIADSTRLYETLGNAHAAELTRKTLFQLRGIIETNHGGVIKTLGDGLLAAFPSADNGCAAALLMMDASQKLTLKLRVGMSFGGVIQQTEDVYGDACNVAARVQAMARPGEILATEFLVDRLTSAKKPYAKLLNRVSLKGKTDPILIYGLRVEADDDDSSATVDATTIGVAPPPGDGKRMTLIVSYRGRNFVVNRLQPRLTVGRDEASDIRIAGRQSSRHHAQLDFSRESFILTDQSTNGTFIRTGGSPPVALRRDSTKLVGAGLIGFGAEPDQEGEDHVIAYRSGLE